MSRSRSRTPPHWRKEQAKTKKLTDDLKTTNIWKRGDKLQEKESRMKQEDTRRLAKERLERKLSASNRSLREKFHQEKPEDEENSKR